MLFHDRKEAGRELTNSLAEFRGRKDVLVLGLARGGIVVAYEVARALSLPLNVVVPRKIGAPGNRELALGSVLDNGEGYFNSSIIHALGVSQNYIKAEIEKEVALAKKRLATYRQFAPMPEIKGKTILLVDDGIATGSTMLASVEAMRKAGARAVIVAAPVSATDAYYLLQNRADDVICPHVREDFLGVGMFYNMFSQTEDTEVVDLLKQAHESAIREVETLSHPAKEETVRIALGKITLEGELHIPNQPRGIVLFAHGSGSSRFSPRNQYVARVLQKVGLATLLIDLLTAEEEKIDELTRALRFDIQLLAERLEGVTGWIKKHPWTASLRIGYFGSSTGAAAALIAAANFPHSIGSVVSRGGRPDLASKYLLKVKAPTLFIVGGADYGVIELNQEAFEILSCVKKFETVPHATHLFEEAGALEKVAQLAANWFLNYLSIPAVEPKRT